MLSKAYAVVFIDPRRRYVKGAAVTTEYPVTQLGSMYEEVQLVAEVTRGRDNHEALSRMRAKLKMPENAWLKRLVDGGRNA